MNNRAWAYVWFVLAAGAAFTVLSLPLPEPTAEQWLTFTFLTILATLAQLFKAEAPNHQLYYATRVFQFAGVLILHPFLYVMLVIIAHVVEWAKERLADSAHLRDWYLQPFNIAVHIIVGLIARQLFILLSGDSMLHLTVPGILIVLGAALVYVVLNHLLVGIALVLARGVPLLESGVLSFETLLPDFINMSLGFIVAVLWQINPWLIAPALSPLVLIYRALQIPQLKRDASTDSKTGLWNARYFTSLYTRELERARRFERPLSFIMADLDLLRNINNTYGHLAGDVVLTGIANIIRQTIREYDVAGRFGGEEFAIVLPETTTRDAMSLAERLREAVENASFSVPATGTKIHATLSLGVAAFPLDAQMANELIHEADIAVYQAKLKGRNCIISASEVPHSTKLESIMGDRLATPPPYPVMPHPRPEPGNGRAAVGVPEAVESVKATVEPAKPTEPIKTVPPTEPAPMTKLYPKYMFPLFVSGVIGTAAILSALAFLLAPQPDLIAIGLFASLAVIAELFQVDLYGEGTVSVSVAVAFAAALITGLPGVSAVSAGIALVHFIRRRPPLYKSVFSWATHMLSGSTVVFVLNVLPIPFLVQNLLLLAIPIAIAAGLYFVIETGLIATAISLETMAALGLTWRNRYRWLANHYIVLCLMGLFLAVAYTDLGLIGVVVFALPVAMMRYAQAQYVDQTKNSMRELTRLNDELILANREVRTASKAIAQLNDELFLTLSKIIDARDPYVSGHASKVAEYATAIAQELGISSERLEHVRQAAFLHDIGKIGVPEQILHKPSKLTGEEYEFVKTHAALGADFLETSQGLRHLAPFVRHHHEWWNGNGYPNKLRGAQIPLEARILSVCDAVEAMASDRPYHRGLSLDQIIAEVKRCSGSQFDPTVVDVFVQIAEREGEALVTNSAYEVVQKQHERSNGELMPSLQGWMVFQGVA